MRPTNIKPLSPSPPRSRWAALLARARASTWAPIAARAAAVVVALVVLGWIGRTAAAGGPSPMTMGAHEGATATGPTPTLGAVDAAVSPLAIAASAVPAPAAAAPVAAASSPNATRARASPGEPVYINHASVDELRRLPGVGPKRAEAILALRQRLGRFQRVEDLLRIKGIGRGAVKKWRPLVRLDTPAAPGSADGGSP